MAIYLQLPALENGYGVPSDLWLMVSLIVNQSILNEQGLLDKYC
jgi:hypothetical protein